MSINIDKALTSAVMNGGLAMDIVHENGSYSTWSGTAYTNHDRVYTPSANREFVEVKNFPADRIAYSLADSDEFVGVFQGVVKFPTDVGAIAAKTKAESFLGLFTIGGSIAYSGQNVFPVSKKRDSGRIENGFFQIVCRVEYRAFIPR